MYTHRKNIQKMILYLTRRCNYRCANCQWILDDPNFFSKTDMPLDEAKEMLSFYRKRGTWFVTLQAEGEALTYPGYEDIVKYATQIGYKQNLVTNGLLVSKYIDLLAEHMQDITVSIDGHDAETYIGYRGGTKQQFDHIISNVRLLATKKLPVILNCIINTRNIDEIPKMIELAEELGVDEMRFGNYHPSKYGEDEYRPLYSDSETIEFYREVMSRKDYKVNIKLPSLYGDKYGCACGSLRNSFLVGPTGDFAPCCHISTDPKYGNYHDNKLGYIDNDNILELYRGFSGNKRPNLPDVCKECPRHMIGRRVKFSKAARTWNFSQNISKELS